MTARYVNYDAIIANLKIIEDIYGSKAEEYRTKYDVSTAELAEVCEETLRTLANTVGLVEFTVEQIAQPDYIRLVERKVQDDGKTETHDS